MAKAKAKYTDIMTPTVTAAFIKINGDVDTYSGGRKYTATAKIEEADAKALQAKLEEIWKNSPEFEKREDSGKETDRPSVGISFNKKYGWQIKATTLPEFTDADGNVTEHIVPIVDGNKQPLDPSTKIWSGSKIALWIGAKPYTTPNNYGVSLKLRGIQVFDLVTGGGAGAFGGAAASDVQTSTGAFTSDEQIPF